VNPEWVADIRDQCLEAGVPFFFKQWDGVLEEKSGAGTGLQDLG
jgi:protein gp37